MGQTGRKVLQNVMATLLLPLCLISMPTEAISDSVVNTAHECDDSRLKANTWTFRYCQIRNRFLDLVIMGSASDAEILAGEILQAERIQCLTRTGTQGVSPREINETLGTLRKEALPKMIKDFGKDEGLRRFKERGRALLRALETLSYIGREERCNQEAVAAYTSRFPSLSRR